MGDQYWSFRANYASCESEYIEHVRVGPNTSLHHPTVHVFYLTLSSFSQNSDITGARWSSPTAAWYWPPAAPAADARCASDPPSGWRARSSYLAQTHNGWMYGKKHTDMQIQKIYIYIWYIPARDPKQCADSVLEGVYVEINILTQSLGPGIRNGKEDSCKNYVSGPLTKSSSQPNTDAISMSEHLLEARVQHPCLDLLARPLWETPE